MTTPDLEGAVDAFYGAMSDFARGDSGPAKALCSHGDDVLLANQPNKRFATVEEIGALAVFLASDAAGSITGTALPVDGGWTAH